MDCPITKRNTLITVLTFSSIAVAEEAVQLPTMVVTSKPEATDNELNSTHLDQEDLQRSGQRELSQVLRGVPSLNLVQGMKGAPSGLSLRGASTGMGLLNIDGIPLHESFPGAVPLDLFPAETFGSSDILRGSSAMLNFGRSLGGTINLHSRNNQKPGSSLHVEGGTFGTLRETALAGNAALVVALPICRATGTTGRGR
jgi:outer membrane cobalamin receptor